MNDGTKESFNRVKFIGEILSINPAQAKIMSIFLQRIPDNKIYEFFVYRMSFIVEKQGKELITKNAFFAYEQKMIEEKLRAGLKPFKTIDHIKKFLSLYYKNKEIAYGAGNFYDFVVIGMDKDGQLINRYLTNREGFFLKLTSEETGDVYKWLLTNQNRIGDIQYKPYFDPVERKKLEASIQPKEDDVLDNVDRRKQLQSSIEALSRNKLISPSTGIAKEKEHIIDADLGL
jgi:hypothetical protein